MGLNGLKIGLTQIPTSLECLLEFWYSDSKLTFGICLLVPYVVHSCRMPCLLVLLVGSRP